MKILPSRVELLSLLPSGSIGAELGVFDGLFSQTIWEQLQPQRLFLVDLWANVTDMLRPDKNGNWVSNPIAGPNAWQLVRQRFAAQIADGRVQLVCAEAIAWLESLPPACLDWAYLDDDHRYQHVAQELEAASRCIRPGGAILGHDYCEVLPGVIQAVDEFCQRRGWPIEAMTDEKPLPVYPRLPGMPSECAYNSYLIRVSTHSPTQTERNLKLSFG